MFVKMIIWVYKNTSFFSDKSANKIINSSIFCSVNLLYIIGILLQLLLQRLAITEYFFPFIIRVWRYRNLNHV